MNSVIFYQRICKPSITCGRAVSTLTSSWLNADLTVHIRSPGTRMKHDISCQINTSLDIYYNRKPHSYSLDTNEHEIKEYYSFKNARDNFQSKRDTHHLLLAERWKSPNQLHADITVRHFSTVDDKRFYSTKPKLKKIEITKKKFAETKEKVREVVEDKVKEIRKDKIATIPNILTTTRIVLTPLLGYLVLQESYTSACLLFVFAGVTDLLDGWIARNFKNQSSAIGSFLDPLADKLLVSVLFITLTMRDLIPVPLTALVVARDVALIGAAFYIRYISLPPPKTLVRFFDMSNPTAQLKPMAISKANTALQLFLVAFTLGAPVFDYTDSALLPALCYLTAATTVGSGVGYMFAKGTFKIFKEQHAKKRKKQT